MGQTQTRLEAKVFDDSAPPWDISAITASTDLEEETVNACWRMWVQNPMVKKGQLSEDSFYKLLDFAEPGTAKAEEQKSDRRLAMKLFQLLDREDNDRLEFPDLMLFLFTMEEEMSGKQKLARSFRLCDQNQSGKISKEEMVEVLDKLEVLDMEHDEKGKVIIPDHVENLFSLMDFAHDKKISEDEFLKATTHYRKLGHMMTISLMEPRRRYMQENIREFMKKEKEEREREEAEEEEKKKERPSLRKRLMKRMGSKEGGGSKESQEEEEEEEGEKKKEEGEEGEKKKEEEVGEGKEGEEGSKELKKDAQEVRRRKSNS